ncbi:MAG: alpha/beta hydrolase-fold protein [Solirubrobacteraceae bacterium]|nr:hypothetical protein [Patulibacter sp.]
MHHLALRQGPRQRIRRLVALSFALAASCVAIFASPALATTGPYGTKWQEPADLKNHTVYSPTNAPAGPLPVLFWGEGACFANGLIYKDFLSEIASHGIIVVASGGPYQLGTTNVGYMDNALDWVKAQNVKAGGAWQGRFNTAKVAVAGHSCGGLEAYQFAAKHAEVGAVGIMNSGQLSRDQTQLDAINAPILYTLGGSGDVAFQNGLYDFNHLKASIPAVVAQDGLGHFGTYFNANGGQYAQVLTNWVIWRINGNAAASQLFIGSCTLCSLPGWRVQTRNLG